jgi:glycosyltransferase involved in cell wall biosynthesis
VSTPRVGAPRILFLGHSASRNGASILLLDILRWLRAHTDWHVRLVVDGRGPLVSEYAAVLPTHVLRDVTRPLAAITGRGGKPAAHVRRAYVSSLLGARGFDLIYANTASAWPLVEAVGRSATPVLWHIHELAYALEVEVTAERARTAFQRASGLVAVSGAVRQMLVETCDVPSERIDVIPGFVKVPPSNPDDRSRAKRSLSSQLGWPEQAFIVGGCGSLGWRKGTDLFAQIAKALSRDPRYAAMRFLWVGGPERGRDALEFAHDVRTLGLVDRLARVPATADVTDHYRAMDVFALTSREDPFPLVMLEAGGHGVPVVCFRDAGGGPDFVEEDAGLIADSMDLRGFAALVGRLHDDPELRRRLGGRALDKVRGVYTQDVQAGRIAETIERRLRRRRAGRTPSGEPGAVSR